MSMHEIEAKLKRLCAREGTAFHRRYGEPFEADIKVLRSTSPYACAMNGKVLFAQHLTTAPSIFKHSKENEDDINSVFRGDKLSSVLWVELQAMKNWAGKAIFDQTCPRCGGIEITQECGSCGGRGIIARRCDEGFLHDIDCPLCEDGVAGCPECLGKHQIDAAQRPAIINDTILDRELVGQMLTMAPLRYANPQPIIIVSSKARTPVLFFGEGWIGAVAKMSECNADRLNEAPALRLHHLPVPRASPTYINEILKEFQI